MIKNINFSWILFKLHLKKNLLLKIELVRFSFFLRLDTKRHQINRLEREEIESIKFNFFEIESTEFNFEIKFEEKSNWERKEKKMRATCLNVNF